MFDDLEGEARKQAFKNLMKKMWKLLDSGEPLPEGEITGEQESQQMMPEMEKSEPEEMGELESIVKSQERPMSEEMMEFLKGGPMKSEPGTAHFVETSPMMQKPKGIAVEKTVVEAIPEKPMGQGGSKKDRKKWWR